MKNYREMMGGYKEYTDLKEAEPFTGNLGIGCEDAKKIASVLIYPKGGFILKRTDGRFDCITGRDEYLGDSLEEAEKFLYETWAKSEYGHEEIPISEKTPQEERNQILIEAFLHLAQGVINISEGLTTIERGSAIYRGMSTLIDHADEIKNAVNAHDDLVNALKYLNHIDSQDGYCICPANTGDRSKLHSTSCRDAFLALAKAEGKL